MNTPIPPLRQTKPFTFLLFLAQRFKEAQISQISGSLTFTTLLALVPLLTVALAVLSALPAFDGVAESFNELVNSLIVPSGASAVTAYLQEFKNQAGKMTTIGVGAMVVTSLMLLHTIEQTFDRIWHIRRARPLWIRLPVYWALLTLGPVLAGLSLSVSAYFFNNSPFSFHYTWLKNALELGWQLALDTFALFLLYKLVPNRFVLSPHALIGSLFTAMLLESTKWLFALYISSFNSYRLIYGAFAAIPVFLLWLYLLWNIILFGALLTANLSYWRGAAYLSANRPNQRFNRMLHILSLLAQAQQQGQSCSFSYLRRHSLIGDDELSELLEQLAQHGIVCNQGHSWLLQTLPENINLRTLFTEFIHNPTQSIPPTRPSLLPDLDSLDINLHDWLHKQNCNNEFKATS